jgi:hypothetical protein
MVGASDAVNGAASCPARRALSLLPGAADAADGGAGVAAPRRAQGAGTLVTLQILVPGSTASIVLTNLASAASVELMEFSACNNWNGGAGCKAVASAPQLASPPAAAAAAVPLGAIIGGAVGGAVALALLSVGVFFLARSSRARGMTLRRSAAAITAAREPTPAEVEDLVMHSKRTLAIRQQSSRRLLVGADDEDPEARMSKGQAAALAALREGDAKGKYAKRWGVRQPGHKKKDGGSPKSSAPGAAAPPPGVDAAAADRPRSARILVSSADGKQGSARALGGSARALDASASAAGGAASQSRRALALTAVDKAPSARVLALGGVPPAAENDDAAAAAAAARDSPRSRRVVTASSSRQLGAAAEPSSARGVALSPQRSARALAAPTQSGRRIASLRRGLTDSGGGGGGGGEPAAAASGSRRRLDSAGASGSRRGLDANADAPGAGGGGSRRRLDAVEPAPAPAASGSSRYLPDGQAAALAKAEAGLAPGWKPVWSKTQRDYYWSHSVTKETTWSKPVA